MTAVPSTLLFSAVVPMYNVEAYLPDLLESLDRQILGDYALECVFVDDGSTDDSADLVAAWLESSPSPAAAGGRLIRQANQGVSAARNTGLAAATGDWVTFPDPDDFLDDGYFAAVARHLAQSAGFPLTLLATNIVFFREMTGTFEDSHGLKDKFARGPRNVRLADDPEAIQCSMAAAFIPRTLLSASGVQLTSDHHASEDAHAIVRVLLAQTDPAIALVPAARYYYRRRAAGNSATQTYRLRRESFIDRFADYVPIARAASQRPDGLPRWFANHLLYELAWPYLKELDPARRALLSPADKTEFLQISADLCSFIEPRWIRTYSFAALTGELRSLFLAFRGEPLDDQPVWAEAWDQRRRQVLLRYLYAGPPPSEDLRVGGRLAEPAAAKVAALDYFGQTTLWERRLWVCLDGDISIALDGRQRELRFGLAGRTGAIGGPGPAGVSPDLRAAASVSAAAVEAYFSAPRAAERTVPLRRPPALPRSSFADQAKLLARQAGLEAYTVLNQRFPQQFGVHIPTAALGWGPVFRNWPRRLAVESPAARHRYGQAWVFADRARSAGGPAEAFYAHLSRTRSNLDCYFVLDPDTPDWERLTKRGFQLVPFRSTDHLSLFRQADRVIVSGLDESLLRPAPYADYPFPLSRSGLLTLLFPDLGNADLAARLNQWDIDQVVCREGQDWEALTADGTACKLTANEVVPTQLGAWDQVQAKLAEM
ncbi:MAG: glycosyltransferase [Propionibacteriaceae bacterium]|nr:glycosyltransferase [Propionibacteriaceae bacterium]